LTGLSTSLAVRSTQAGLIENPAGQGSQNKIGQNRIGQNRIGQDRNGQNRIGQNRIGQNRIERGAPGQSRTDRVQARWDQER
jgi:hypothetical protein